MSSQLKSVGIIVLVIAAIASGLEPRKIIVGAFLVPAGIFNLRGWWIAATPVDGRAISLAAILLASPLVLKRITKTAKHDS